MERTRDSSDHRPQHNGNSGKILTAGAFQLCPGLPPTVRIEPYHGEVYYDIAPIRHSHYEWKTATAFLFNGIAGGAQILATLIDLFGSEKDRALVKAGRYLASSGGLASTITLISSLHRWRRWYNMLRIFKKTSPMSIGIWVITPFSLFSAFALGGQVLEDSGYIDAGRPVGRLFSLPAAALGGILISYMGTELEETNMPVWAGSHPLLAPLYAASGLANSTSVLLAVSEVVETSDQTLRGLNTLALLAGVAELALALMLLNRWDGAPEAAAYKNSPYSFLFRFGYIGLGLTAPLLLSVNAFVNGSPPNASVLAAIKIAGALLMQLCLVYGGRESGRGTSDYFQLTGPGRLNGIARIEPTAPIQAEESPPEQPGLPEERGNNPDGPARETVNTSSLSSSATPGRSGKSSSMLLGLGLLALGAGLFAVSGGKRSGAS